MQMHNLDAAAEILEWPLTIFRRATIPLLERDCYSRPWFLISMVRLQTSFAHDLMVIPDPDRRIGTTGVRLKYIGITHGSIMDTQGLAALISLSSDKRLFHSMLRQAYLIRSIQRGIGCMHAAARKDARHQLPIYGSFMPRHAAFHARELDMSECIRRRLWGRQL